ncbi:pyridoxal phosphate-dependent aminotransferase [Streptomyces sp. NPDC001530]|uniref:pyridoxal phosphate-dependent aminotransferase n=1 Tax=Streptomyces sp. NPDC001530 TaxID=3364582 RepID=UPI00369F9E18
MSGRKVSPNLALDHLVAQRRAAGESIVHLGFGESRLPVFPPLVEQLVAGARRNGYGPVAGDLAVRESVAGYFARRGLPTDAEQIVVAPGSKPLLMALQAVVPGDTVIPCPAWNTYAPQAELAGKTVIRVPIPEDCGGVPDPAALRASIHTARASGHDPRLVVLTLPDNPTGTLAPAATVREICAIAEAEDLLIISDEIYRDLMHDPTQTVLSPAEVVPHRTVVLTGLSKNLALGGWRVGVARFPAGAWGTDIRERVTSYASEVWSTLAGPMQQVAEYSFAEPPELIAHLAASARLHGALARAVHRIVVGAGAKCRAPQAGFYLYPDFEPMREKLAERGITDSTSLQHHLLEELGVAVLDGRHLGDDPQALRFRIATSMLYGQTEEEQWEALRSSDPLRLRHVAELLTRIEESFAKLIP